MSLVNLLSINSVACPHIDKGSISVSYDDTYNTYTAEDGHSTIEEIRTGKMVINVSYKGLLEADVKSVIGAITLVSTVVVYNPATDATSTISAKISNISTQKVVYEQGISAWSLSFKIEEL